MDYCRGVHCRAGCIDHHHRKTIGGEMKEKKWGGKRPNQTGRPKKEEGVRKQHQLRAYDDEWELIQAFAKMVKHGNKESCIEFIKQG